MKKVLCIIIFISFSRQVLGQTNLVPNWSFETFTICPNSGGQITSAVPWVGQSTNSSDYFNACSSNALNVPYAAAGYQYAKDGVAFSGIWTTNPPGTEYREYAQVKLIDSLINNRCYYVEFYCNLNNESEWGTNNLAANFDKLQWSSTGTGFVLSLPQHITKYGNPIIKDTLNWTKVSGIYTSNGGERYITIGNFKFDASTDTSKVNSIGNGYGAYYYIDAVSVYSINPTGIMPWSYPDANVNIGDSVYIGNTMGGSFNSNWYTLPGNVFIKNAPGLYVKPVTTSTYVVTFTLCGVPHSDTLKVTLNGVGIEEYGLKNLEFIISPNPNTGLIQLEISNTEIILQNSLIKIYDIFNREIKTFKLLGNKQTLELQDIKDGVYYLQLLQDSKVLLTKKIIKQ